jgi:hypothetical protein
MFQLFAQGTDAGVALTPPSSGDFWNPSNWQWLGGDKFLLLCMMGFFMWFVWRALSKWDVHLDRSEKLQGAQIRFCGRVHQSGGVGNNESILKAGHAAASVLEAMAQGISDKTGKDVKTDIGIIHDALNVRPATQLVTKSGDDDAF